MDRASAAGAAGGRVRAAAAAAPSDGTADRGGLGLRAERRLGPLDALLGLALLALLGFYVHGYLDTGGRPEEDAAMLLRYSAHLADGHGIVWNIGEQPLDGATDFLFMVLVAGLHRLGLPLEAAARGLGLAAHAATVLLVFFGARGLNRAPRSWALVPAVFLALGPGLRHLAACYATPLFALAVTVGWLLASRLADPDTEPTHRASLGFAMAALTMGLARPEGVFLAGFMLVAVVLARRGSRLLPVLGAFALVFATLGFAYFLWRWHYFGHPLPNPFYKKGGGVLHWHSLKMSLRNLERLGGPFLAVPAVGLLLREARRAAVFVSLPVLLFILLWVLISDETNYVMRFQYPIVPVLLLGCVPVAQAIAARWAPRKAALAPASSRSRAWRIAAAWTVALSLATALALVEDRQYRFIAPRRMGLYDAALVLRDYAGRDLTLATTEAGLLPFYSTWRAIDAWGLNDREIARNGTIDEGYLDRRRPEVIVIHAYFSPGVPDHGRGVETRSLGRRWYEMVMTLKRYAESHDYRLAACFGRNTHDTHYYYVRRGFPLSDEIAARLRRIPYYWDGERTFDFTPPPAAPAASAGEHP